MLDRPMETWRVSEADPAPGIDLGETMRAALAGLLRQWLLVAGCVAGFVLVGVVYVLNKAPEYTATAAIIVDLRSGGDATGEMIAPVALLADAFVASEVAILGSRELTSRVVDRLLPPERTAPQEESPGALAATLAAIGDGLRSLFGSADEAAPPPPPDPAVAALQARERMRRNLMRSLEVSHDPDTFVVTIAFTSGDPVFAARVVNTLIEEYVLIEAEASYDNTRRVNEWLSTRVQLLADSVADADAAVEAYRNANDLYAVRGGVLPANAEFVAANEQLIETRNRIFDVAVQIDKLREEIASGSINTDTVSGNSMLADLQRQYVQLTERERDYLGRLGEAHARTRETRQDMARLRQIIVEELERLMERLVSRRETLERQAVTTAARIEELSAAASEDAQKSIRLRELEREAEAKRRLFEAMLERLNETTHEQTFEPSPARVIARAVPPDAPSAPRTNILLALAVFGGLVFGCGLAFAREVLDDVVRRADAVSGTFGTPLLGLAPLIGADLSKVRRKVAARSRGFWRSALRDLTRQGLRMRFAADNEGSMFAETLRALDVRLTQHAREGEDCRVVGFTSSRKGEGKSTLAGNFAAMQAARGYRVALVDFDVRASAFARAVRRLPRQNVLERLVADPAGLAELRPSPELAGVHILHPQSHIVWSDANTRRQLRALLAAMRERFDYVVVDIPPMTGLVDSRIAADTVDHMVLAIEWGRTRTRQLRRALLGNEAVRERLLGAIFTKVRPGAYARYNGSDFADYYRY